jgi:hypothetical protein
VVHGERDRAVKNLVIVINEAAVRVDLQPSSLAIFSIHLQLKSSELVGQCHVVLAIHENLDGMSFRGLLGNPDEVVLILK